MILKEKNVQELESMLNHNKDFILLDVRTDNEVLISKISDKSTKWEAIFSTSISDNS